MSATSSRNSVPPCARSKVPILRGVAVVAGLAAEQLDLEPLRPHRRAIDRRRTARRRAASARAAAAPTTSLPEPGAPVISTRLPVGATRSICWRSWLTAGEAPTRSSSPPARSRSSAFSRRSCAASIARVDDQQQPVGLERLLDEVVGADLDRLDRGLDRAVAADHDDRDRRHLGAQTGAGSRCRRARCPAARCRGSPASAGAPGSRPAPRCCRRPRGWRSPRPSGRPRSACGCRLRRRRSGCHAPWADRAQLRRSSWRPAIGATDAARRRRRPA